MKLYSLLGYVGNKFAIAGYADKELEKFMAFSKKGNFERVEWE